MTFFYNISITRIILTELEWALTSEVGTERKISDPLGFEPGSPLTIPAFMPRLISNMKHFFFFFSTCKFVVWAFCRKSQISDCWKVKWNWAPFFKRLFPIIVKPAPMAQWSMRSSCTREIYIRLLRLWRFVIVFG